MSKADDRSKVRGRDYDYDPLRRENLARSVANELTGQDLARLETLEPFDGAGIYGLYYDGDHELYRPLTECNARIAKGSPQGERFIYPIYIGRAVPSGSRRGMRDDRGEPRGQSLFRRLLDHKKSIEKAEGLSVEHFRFRYLRVTDIFIPLGEDVLLNEFKPIWNAVLDGFGNHDPGVTGRETQMLSPWDAIHPGRDWAYKRRKVKPEKGEKVESGKNFVFVRRRKKKILKAPKLEREALKALVATHFKTYHSTCDAGAIEALMLGRYAPDVSAVVSLNDPDLEELGALVDREPEVD